MSSSVAPPSSTPPSAGAGPHVLAPGTIVAERYRVERTLGEGGMGIVYLAEHVHMRKRVALKVLLPEWTSAPEVVARFEREAVAAGRVAHPNVAAATDFGRLPDGAFFLVLEFIEGRTLRTVLESGALAPVRALRIARGTVAGIAAAHAIGIVHRDLKPENVMLVERDGDPDFVKVLDFGIAKDAATIRSGAALTSAGAILGTPDYMAPEQAIGGDVDARADLYSVGVMLYEMLTGECPFRGGAVTVLRQHLLNPVPPLPASVVESVPAGVQSLLARLLEKEPGARFQTAADLLATLDEHVVVPSLRGVRFTAPSHSGRTTLPDSAEATRSRAIRVALVVAVAALLVAIALVAMRAGPTASTSATTSPSAAKSYVPLPPPPAPHAASGTASAPVTTARALPPLPAPPVPRQPSSPPAPTPAGSASAKKPGTPSGKHTGPGGIYIPPPSEWFK